MYHNTATAMSGPAPEQSEPTVLTMKTPCWTTAPLRILRRVTPEQTGTRSAERGGVQPLDLLRLTVRSRNHAAAKRDQPGIEAKHGGPATKNRDTCICTAVKSPGRRGALVQPPREPYWVRSGDLVITWPLRFLYSLARTGRRRALTGDGENRGAPMRATLPSLQKGRGIVNQEPDQALHKYVTKVCPARGWTL